MSWGDERRADRRLDAELAIKRDDQRREQERKDRAQRAEQDRLNREQRAKERRERREERREQLRKLGALAKKHALDLMFAPIIVVPAVLAWTSMAAFGHAIWGPLGWGLPLFSEAGAWIFAVANTMQQRRHPGAPTWHLQTGVFVFAAVSGVLNFLHGLDTPAMPAIPATLTSPAIPASPGGAVVGAVMGMVSVGGVVAHQLITAGPRRTRAERDVAKIARRAARREYSAAKAATRKAVVEIDPDGSARLVYVPGRYTLRRLNRGLDRAVVPGLPVDPEAADWDAALAGLDAAIPATGEPQSRPSIDQVNSVDSSSIATLDHDADQADSDDRSDSGRKRTFGELVAEFESAVEENRLDPTKAEAIRLALKCSSANARKLRNYHAASKHRKDGRK